MTELEHSRAETRAALAPARKRIVRLNFGTRNDPVLAISVESCGMPATWRGNKVSEGGSD